MRRRAPRSRRHPTWSSRLRHHGFASVPLFAGFVGALCMDAALRPAEAAPSVPTVLAMSSTGNAEPAPSSGSSDLLHPHAAPVEPANVDVQTEKNASADGETRLGTKGSTAAAVAAGSTTREATLEHALTKTLVAGRTPYGATVLLEAHTGRVLAIAEHSTRGEAEGLALKPIAPAASVFKIVTTSALLGAGVSGANTVCTYGGRTRMQPALLVDNPRRDRDCRPFADALPHSLNVAVAKMSLKHLDPERLRDEATRWGFDAPLPTIGFNVQPSTAVIPDDPFGFAEAAAGFGNVKLSAMHGAVLASIVANQGMLVAPTVSDDVPAPKPQRVISSGIARKLQAMMTESVTTGTARRVFHGGGRLGVSAAGKTGSLADYQTGLDTSWFVGFAPADRPEVIVASVVVNTAKWHVKATGVAKDALRAYFASHPATKTNAVVASRQ